MSAPGIQAGAAGIQASVAGIQVAPGLRYVPDYFSREQQAELLQSVRAVLSAAPLFRPSMPRTGVQLSVAMSNCGRLGWVADRAGYRYTASHPETGLPWPAIPRLATDAWADLCPAAPAPEACLINYYAAGARMGLHQDRDEDDLAAPVLSLSLGDSCVFRYGGTARRDPTRSLKLASGDALVLGGAARLAFHGVDRVLAGSSSLLAEGGRFNLTLRRVTPPADNRR